MARLADTGRVGLLLAALIAAQAVAGGRQADTGAGPERWQPADGLRRMAAAYGRLEDEQRRWVKEHFSASDPQWDALDVRHAELVARDRRIVEAYRRLSQGAEVPLVRGAQTGEAVRDGGAAPPLRRAELEGLAGEHAKVLREDTEMAREHDRLVAERARHR
ncbi:MAG TPA: hypothetical protein VMB50_22915 [Myxococcales bacterium]|nr:hypothetical protein [Myxococcales bacterium]